jgi:hypothetical protein
MLAFLEKLDRRWVFLLMGLAVAIPILFPLPFQYKPSALARSVFDEIERLPDGSRVLFSFDYDPATSGELSPMARAMLYHCGKKKHKLYVMALFGPGKTLGSEAIQEILLKYAGDDYTYGEDYVELGYQTGNEGVIKVAVTDLAQMFPTDVRGTPLSKIPVLEGVENFQAMDLLVAISAGDPGSKQWIQYFISAYPNTRMVTGTTGVQSVSLYPYIPNQLAGMLGAIKGAAEYETIVNEKYPGPDGEPVPELTEAQRRMGPQLTAHLLMVSLIVLGNVVFLMGRKKAHRSGGGR